MFPRPTHVRPTGPHQLVVRFEDDTEAELDFSPMLSGPGIFEELQDSIVFAGAQVDPEAKTIVWPNGADICPDVLYHLATGATLPGPLAVPPARLVRAIRNVPDLAT